MHMCMGLCVRAHTLVNESVRVQIGSPQIMPTTNRHSKISDQIPSMMEVTEPVDSRTKVREAWSLSLATQDKSPFLLGLRYPIYYCCQAISSLRPIYL